MKAIWNNKIVASYQTTIVLEGNHYFPLSAVNPDFLKKSNKTSVCPWKGIASYYDLIVDGQINEGAVWIYLNPKSEASHIAGHVAFWKGVEITQD